MATNAYATLTQLKLVTGIPDMQDDTLLDMALGAASRQIDGYVGYRFWVDSAVKVREFYADDYRCLYVDEGISTDTGLIVAIDADNDGTFETTLTIGTDFILKPSNAPDMVPVLPYTEIALVDNYTWPMYSNGRPGAQVTAKFGWPAVPDDVALACVLLAHELFKSKDTPFGAAGAALGDLMVTGSRTVSYGMANRTVRELLAPYRKVAVG